MILTFIIPIYNVEHWICRCLDSLRNNGLKLYDFEVICIDDGSNDQSVKIIEQYANENSNLQISIIEQKNFGPGAARNNGIRHAQGDYVCFIDADDYIEPGKFLYLFENVKQNQLDVLCYGYRLVYESNNEIRYEAEPTIDTTQGKVLNGPQFFCQTSFLPVVWNALYRRQFLVDNNLWFMEGVYHEDQDFPPRVFCLAKQIARYPEIVYNYVQREGGIMRNTNNVAKKAKDLLCVADSLYSFAENLPSTITDLRLPVKEILMSKVYFAFGQSLRNYTKGKSSIAEYTSKPYYPIKINNYIDKHEARKYKLMNLSLRLYLIVYGCFKRKSG